MRVLRSRRIGPTLTNVQLIQEGLNPDLQVSAIVLVMFDARTRLAEQVADEVREHFGELVLTTVVQIYSFVRSTELRPTDRDL